MNCPPILAPCDICQLPDKKPKGIWYERYGEHLCSVCATQILEWNVIEADLMTQLEPVVEQWTDCWLACGVEAASLRGLASIVDFDNHMPDALKSA